MRGSRALCLLAASVASLATVAIVALPGSAAASSHKKPAVRDGFYSSLVGVKSTDVEFHVRSTGKRIPDLTVGCLPTVASQAVTSISIAVHPPALHISNGRFSYHGKATITEDYAGAPKIATTTMSISGHHVNGPVHHYTFEGNHLKQTTAFKGSASSPACKKLPRGGQFTLFGPVSGE
jgi:hypothetical protein